MQKIRSQKSLKNFYIRPTTGVGSKGAFSVEKRDNNSNRDMKNINELLMNNNNVLFQVNSYGFKPTTAHQNYDRQEQHQMTKSEAIPNKRQSYQNNDYALAKNQMSDEFRILVKHKVFSGTANFSTGNNNNQKTGSLHPQSNKSQKSSPTQIQLSHQYKHTSSEQHRENNPFSDEARRNTMNNSKGFQKISSPSNKYLNGYTSNLNSTKNKENNNAPFEDDISEVRPNNDQKQDQNENQFNSEDSEREGDNYEGEDDTHQEQLSEINIKEANNIEDSMNDIQELATNGFDLTAFKDELKQSKSPLSKYYSSNNQAQIGQNSDKNQSSKGRFPVDSHDNSETNNSDAKRFSSLQKNISVNLYNFTQSKLSEQRDETTPSVHQIATSNHNLLNGNSKENNIQFINMKQDPSENRISRPITSQNNISRIKNLQMQTKYSNLKQTSNNFYDLFANQNNKPNAINTYTNQLLATLPLKQSAKIPFFHNYYRNEQIKNLQQTNSFSVKKAQIFSFQPKHNNLMSRQGQRKDSANALQSNVVASQIQQQLIQGINNSNTKTKQMFSGFSNTKL